MKIKRKILTVLATVLIFGALSGCTKKEDPAMAELKAQMQAMQDELNKAKSGNATPEEIAKLENAVAEVAKQEQAAEEKKNAPKEATAPAASQSVATTTPTATPAASTSTATGGFQMSGKKLTKYNGTSKNVVIPDGVIEIDYSAFERNTNITSVTIPNSVTNVGFMAFQGCTNLSSVTIGNGVTYIGEKAFLGCTNLTSLIIPNSVTGIAMDAFQSTGLSTVTIGSGITQFIDQFYASTSINVDPSNPAYSSSDGVLYNKNKTVLIKYPYMKANASFTIPNGVTTITARSFDPCEKLTSLTIPASVTSIEVNAFANCKNLTRVTFQGNITEENLHYGAFGSRSWGFIGNIRDKYIEMGPGTYTRQSGSMEWTKEAQGA